MNLTELGWNSFFQESMNSILLNVPKGIYYFNSLASLNTGNKDRFQKQDCNTYNQKANLIPARITKEERHSYNAISEQGEIILKINGKMLYNTESRMELPKAGDWVLAQICVGSKTGIVYKTLKRKTIIKRQAASTSKNIGLDGQLNEQILAANVDTVFCVTGLDQNFSTQRIERYLIAVWEAGAKPVIILNKSDICSEHELEERLEEVKSTALGIPYYAVSAINNSSIENLKRHLKSGETAVFIGSSGVGKSSLVNSFFDSELQVTKNVRGKDSHGMHTTTNRELFFLPGGGILIDTPGMREFQTWADEDAFNNTFEDIETLGKTCRFSNCTHHDEPGCEVQNAIITGELDSKRLKNYYKLENEMKFFDQRKRNKDRINEKKFKRKVQSKARNKIRSIYYTDI
jgi:ribosome biogenesis GTPase / thiamine phosphate phosphatase